MDSTIYERASELRRLVRSRQLAAIHLISLMLGFFTRRRLRSKKVNLPKGNCVYIEKKCVKKFLNLLSSSGKARKIIRMNIDAFLKL